MLYRVVRAVFWVYLKVFHGFHTEGSQNLPDRGPAIVASNHRHWLDPVLLACSFRRPICFMAKEELFRSPVIARLLRAVGAFPVRRGQMDRAALRTALEALRGGKVLGIFPEGTRSRSGQLLRAEPGVGFMADKGQAPVVPCGIIGNYRLFQPLQVVVDDPVTVVSGQAPARTEAHQATADCVMERIAALIGSRTLITSEPTGRQ